MPPIDGIGSLWSFLKPGLSATPKDKDILINRGVIRNTIRSPNRKDERYVL